MRYEVTSTGYLVHHGQVRAESGIEAEEIEAFVDSFVEELEKIAAEEIDVSTNLKTCELSVSITLEAEDLPSAQVEGGGTIRTAFHAAGAGTPTWSIDWVEAKTVPDPYDGLDADLTEDLVEA